MPLWHLLHKHRSMMVTHGKNPAGADLYVAEWFRLPEQAFNRATRRYESSVEYLALEDPHPADWKRGKIAGHIRNQEMVDGKIAANDEVGPPIDLCYAWPTPASRGTWDCIARAWVKGIKVFVWHHLEIGRGRWLTDAEGEDLARRRLGWGRSA